MALEPIGPISRRVLIGIFEESGIVLPDDLLERKGAGIGREAIPPRSLLQAGGDTRSGGDHLRLAWSNPHSLTRRNERKTRRPTRQTLRIVGR